MARERDPFYSCPTGSLGKPRSWPTPELRIPNAAAQTRVVSLAGIRFGSWESARAGLVSPAQASLPRSWPTPELRIPNAAAQPRVVSKAKIRLDSRKSVRSFKGIICVDISEFVSYMPPPANMSMPLKTVVEPKSMFRSAVRWSRCDERRPTTALRHSDDQD